MKKVFLLGSGLAAIFCLATVISLAQPWSIPVTNSTPQVRPPPTNWVATPASTPALVNSAPPPAHHAAPPPALAVTPLPAGILAFDAEQKEYTTKPGEQNAAFVFNVTNISPAEVTVTFIQTSCGCTTSKVQVPFKIAPGASTEIPINMSVVGKSDVVIKTVTVHTDKGQKVVLVKSIITAMPNTGGGMGADRERNQQLAQADRQAVFKDDCARCHVAPTIGKMGKELYTVACGICHNAEHRAKMVPDLHELKVTPNAEYWKFFVVNGKPGTLMPAFSQSQGGPLSDAQIASLVEYLVKDFPSTKTNAPAMPAHAH